MYGASLEPIYIIGAGIALGVVGLALNTRLGLIRREDYRLCKKCGYDVTGNESGICPECGLRIVAQNDSDQD